MRNHFPAIALAFGVMVLEAIAQTPATNTTQMLESLREKHKLPGLAVVVIKDRTICDRAVTGVRKVGEAPLIRTNDLFHIGSCTKAMTATLAALLVGEGKLRWNSTIAETFPEWKGSMDTAYESVTLEQLLTHRAGVPEKPPAAAWRKAWNQEGTPTEQRYKFISAVLAQPPDASPGTKTIYSNQGYAIAGAMMEKVTGESWEKLMSEKLFKPLQMNSAGFGAPGTSGKVDQPWGHVRNGESLEADQIDNPPAIGPGGTVHCTLDDLAKFVMFHLNNGDKAGLLPQAALEKLQTSPEGSDYAGGWIVTRRGWAGGKVLTHAGSNTRWYVVMWLAPGKNFAVIAATNFGGPGADNACDEVAAAMITKWLAR